MPTVRSGLTHTQDPAYLLLIHGLLGSGRNWRTWTRKTTAAAAEDTQRYARPTAAHRWKATCTDRSAARCRLRRWRRRLLWPGAMISSVPSWTVQAAAVRPLVHTASSFSTKVNVLHVCFRRPWEALLVDQRCHGGSAHRADLPPPHSMQSSAADMTRLAAQVSHRSGELGWNVAAYVQ